MTLERFDGLVAVVTGAASGIGRSLARVLHAAGASVAVADVEHARAERVAAELAASADGRAGAFECDVSDISSVEALADSVAQRFGRVNVLCNNAGVGVGGTLDQIEPNNFRWIFDVNVFGVYHGVRAFAPMLKDASRRGEFAHVLNTASEHSLGIPGWVPPSTAYSASKHAVLGLSDGLRRDLADDGVGVSVLCPGYVATDIWDAARNRPQHLGGASRAPSDLGERLAAIGQDPDETARIALAAVAAGQFLIITDSNTNTLIEARATDMRSATDWLAAYNSMTTSQG